MASPGQGLVAGIEQKTLRKLTLKTNLGSSSACHPQTASPLYNKLPKELRDLCFEFTTAQYEDHENKYKENAYYSRPGHRAPLKSSTNLLLTCKRIWLEAYALPMRLLELLIWERKQRGPPTKKLSEWVGRLTALNRECFSNIHFFLQMYQANGMFHLDTPEVPLFNMLKPKNLHITIRHTDWFWWERDAPLALEDYWVRRILNAPHLSSIHCFKLELETLTKTKPQLDAIVDRLSQLEGAVYAVREGRNRHFRLDSIPKPWHWSGPTNIYDTEYEPYKNLKQLDYCVVTLTWKSIKTIAAPTEIPEVPELPSARGTHPFPCHVYNNRTPRMSPVRLAHQITRRRMQSSPRHFPLSHQYVIRESHERAMNSEKDMRWRFRRAFADIEAERLEIIWAAEGSLLKFED